MTSLAHVADAYDAWVKQRYDELDEMYYHYNGEVARRFGAGDRRTRNFLILTTTLYGLYTASQLVGQGFVDLLRVGESAKDPTAGNLLQDGLRVVSLAAPAFKAFRLGGAVGVSGGGYLNSCGATATAVAARLSGTKLVMRLKDFQSVLKLPISPKSAEFPGVTLAQIAQALNDIGAKTIHRTIKSWQDVEAMLDLKKGPVVFVVKLVINGSKENHAMAAFRVMGETSIADQSGVSSAASIRAQLAKMDASYMSAWLVEDSALVHAVNLAGGTAANANVAASIANRPEDLSWLLETLLIPAWIVPGRVIWGLGDLVNEKLGRPPLGASDGLSADATKVLRVTPDGAGKSTLLIQVGSGLATDAFLAAVAELEAKGRVRVNRSPGAPLGIASIVRIK